MHSSRAVVITVELEHPFLALAVYAAASVGAARGDWDNVEEQIRLISMPGPAYEQVAVCRALAEVQVATARGEPIEILAPLDPLLAIQPREGVDEPGFWSCSICTPTRSSHLRGSTRPALSWTLTCRSPSPGSASPRALVLRHRAAGWKPPAAQTWRQTRASPTRSSCGIWCRCHSS